MHLYSKTVFKYDYFKYCHYFNNTIYYTIDNLNRKYGIEMCQFTVRFVQNTVLTIAANLVTVYVHDDVN